MSICNFGIKDNPSNIFLEDINKIITERFIEIDNALLNASISERIKLYYDLEKYFISKLILFKKYNSASETQVSNLINKIITNYIFKQELKRDNIKQANNLRKNIPKKSSLFIKYNPKDKNYFEEKKRNTMFISKLARRLTEFNNEENIKINNGINSRVNISRNSILNIENLTKLSNQNDNSLYNYNSKFNGSNNLNNISSSEEYSEMNSVSFDDNHSNLSDDLDEITINNCININILKIKNNILRYNNKKSINIFSYFDGNCKDVKRSILSSDISESEYNFELFIKSNKVIENRLLRKDMNMNKELIESNKIIFSIFDNKVIRDNNNKAIRKNTKNVDLVVRNKKNSKLLYCIKTSKNCFISEKIKNNNFPIINLLKIKYTNSLLYLKVLNKSNFGCFINLEKSKFNGKYVITNNTLLMFNRNYGFQILDHHKDDIDYDKIIYVNLLNKLNINLINNKVIEFLNKIYKNDNNESVSKLFYLFLKENFSNVIIKKIAILEYNNYYLFYRELEIYYVIYVDMGNINYNNIYSSEFLDIINSNYDNLNYYNTSSFNNNNLLNILNNYDIEINYDRDIQHFYFKYKDILTTNYYTIDKKIINNKINYLKFDNSDAIIEGLWLYLSDFKLLDNEYKVNNEYLSISNNSLIMIENNITTISIANITALNIT